MFAVWGIVPRGGYIECLAWALPTLWAYRALAGSHAPELSRGQQVIGGFWFAFGYFVNPMAVIVYVTLALDWTFGRHGADLRRERHLTRISALVASPVSRWPLCACSRSCVMSIRSSRRFALRRILRHLPAHPGRLDWARRESSSCWRSRHGGRGPARLLKIVSKRPWAVAGIVLAWSPFVVHAIGVRLKRFPNVPSLPIWIAAPWKVGPSAWTAFGAMGTLVGCDPRTRDRLIGQGVAAPPGELASRRRFPHRSESHRGRRAVGLILAELGRKRCYWSSLFTLRRGEVASGPELTGLFLCVALILYLLQGTSPNASSVRYLLPVWVALPGLFACGLHALPRRVMTARGECVDRPLGDGSPPHRERSQSSQPHSAARGGADTSGSDGDRRADTVALIVANLSHGQIVHRNICRSGRVSATASTIGFRRIDP